MRFLSMLWLMLLGSTLAFGLELNTLYKKNRVKPKTTYEISVVKHVKNSYEKAMRHESKLNKKKFGEIPFKREGENPDFTVLLDLSSCAYYHLINNLCELKGASHLHMGVLAGDSFVAALYGNQEELNKQIAVDWFKECPKDVFLANCKKHLNIEKCQIIDEECFNVAKSSITSPIDIYLYDADHCLMAHEKAITYYNDVFADVFIVVIDDWECPWIRKPTFKAFDKMGYKVLYEAAIPGPSAYQSGQYVAVLKK